MATTAEQFSCHPESYFYPRHPHGWRPPNRVVGAPRAQISIHATLTGGDARQLGQVGIIQEISIHATLTGGDPFRSVTVLVFGVFLSTPPSRVATSHRPACGGITSNFYPRHPHGWRRLAAQAVASRRRYFYPRHPHGWRLGQNERVGRPVHISIHATLTGGDVYYLSERINTLVFLSTPPSRVATALERWWALRFCISIHATLTGGDRKGSQDGGGHQDFYPRHPHGWRLCKAVTDKPHCVFLSTPPSRVATTTSPSWVWF